MKLNTELRYDVPSLKLALHVETGCPECGSRLARGKIGHIVNDDDEFKEFVFFGWKCSTHGTTTPSHRTTSDDTNEQNTSA